MDHEILCPGCERHFSVWTFSLGMSDLAQFQCTGCPIVLATELPYDRRIGEIYDRLSCECGGEFRRHAPFRCPRCNAPFSMEQLKAQIKWRGTSDGRPGVCITKCIDENRNEWSPINYHAG